MLGLAAAVMLQAAGVEAAAGTPQPSVIRTPDWLRRPSGADIARVYPSRASREGRNGRATLECGVKTDGTLDTCTVLYEDPSGHRFGEAALKLKGRFQMQPTTPSGQPVAGGTVRIPLRFFITNGAMDGYDIGIACYGETSARVEQAPTDDQAESAARFYRRLVQSASEQMKAQPSELQATLERARTAALTPGPDYSPGLARCMTVYREQMAKTAR